MQIMRKRRLIMFDYGNSYLGESPDSSGPYQYILEYEDEPPVVLSRSLRRGQQLYQYRYYYVATGGRY